MAKPFAVNITGVQEVINKLAESGRITGERLAQRMVVAGVFIQKESQKIVPIKTSVLKNSAYTRNVGGPGFDADIVVGYIPHYAVYVHENLQAKHAPGKEAKYLENPIKRNQKRILNILGQRLLK